MGGEKGQGLQKCEKWTQRHRPEPPKTALLTPQANTNNFSMCDVSGMGAGNGAGPEGGVWD